MKLYAHWCGKDAYDDEAEASKVAESWNRLGRRMGVYVCRHPRCLRRGYFHLRTEASRKRVQAVRRRRRESAPHQAWENEGGGSTVRWLATGQITPNDK